MTSRILIHFITCLFLFLCLGAKSAQASESSTPRVRVVVNVSHKVYEAKNKPTCSIAGRYVHAFDLAVEGPKKPIVYAGAKCQLKNGFWFQPSLGYFSASKTPFASIEMGYKSKHFITNGQLDLDHQGRIYSNTRLAGKYKWFSLGPMYEGYGYLGKNVSPGIGLSPAIHFGKWGALVGLIEYRSKVTENRTRQGELGGLLLFIINLQS